MTEREQIASNMFLAVSSFIQVGVGTAEQSNIPESFLKYTFSTSTAYLLDVWKYINGGELPEWYEKVCAAVQDQPDTIGAGRWVPVSERLPEDGGSVLVTCSPDYKKAPDTIKKCLANEPNAKSIYEVPLVTIGDVFNGEWYVGDEPVSERFKVIAWQPLPEPYSAPIVDAIGVNQGGRRSDQEGKEHETSDKA